MVARIAAARGFGGIGKGGGVMGSRAKRTRNGQAAHPKPIRPKVTGIESGAPLGITDIDRISLAYGEVVHMPRYTDVPEAFERSSHPCARLASKWFFEGLSQEDMARLTPREGVNKDKALRAIGAVLRSFEPKHEHKEAGAACLLDRWFIVAQRAP
jgi:hypothetical protein